MAGGPGVSPPDPQDIFAKMKSATFAQGAGRGAEMFGEGAAEGGGAGKPGAEGDLGQRVLGVCQEAPGCL